MAILLQASTSLLPDALQSVTVSPPTAFVAPTHVPPHPPYPVLRFHAPEFLNTYIESSLHSQII